MYQRPSSPLPIGGVLDNAVRLLKASFRQVIGLAVASSFLASFWRLFDDSFERLMTGTLDPAQGLGWALVPMALGGVGGIYLFLVIVARMHAFSANRPATLGETFRRALVRLPAVLLCLLAMAIGPMFAIIATIFAVAGLGAGGVLAAVLLIPFGVLTVYWFLSLFLPVAANIGGLEALRRSFNLVVDNFWRTVTLLTVVTFVGFAAMAAVGALAAALGALASVGSLSYDAVVFFVELVVSSITSPFTVAAMLALLRDLELRREGEDLAQRIEALQ